MKFRDCAAAVKVRMLVAKTISRAREQSMLKRVILIILLSFFALPAFSVQEIKKEKKEETATIFGAVDEKEIYSLGNIVETKESASANIDVITYEDMKEQGSPLLTEMLNQLGSVTVQTSGSIGDVTSFRIRGTDRVRVTIDGMRADSPVDNKFYLNNYLTDDFERIEVIKGPQGNVGGVNASGGLVSLQTRRGYGSPSVEIESGMGNLGTFKERFAVQGGDKEKDYYLGVNWLKSEGTHQK